jgi:hypothetical protein
MVVRRHKASGGRGRGQAGHSAVLRVPTLAQRVRHVHQELRGGLELLRHNLADIYQRNPDEYISGPLELPIPEYLDRILTNFYDNP